MLHIRENRSNIEHKSCKNSSTLKIKFKSEPIETKPTNKIKITSMKKRTSIPKTKKGYGAGKGNGVNACVSARGFAKKGEARSVVVVSTPSHTEPRSRKRTREIEENSPSGEALSKKNLTEVPPLIPARWKTSGFRDNLISSNLKDVTVKI